MRIALFAENLLGDAAGADPVALYIGEETHLKNVTPDAPTSAGCTAGAPTIDGIDNSAGVLGCARCPRFAGCSTLDPRAE